MPAFFFPVRWSNDVSSAMADNPGPTLAQVEDAVAFDGGRIRMQAPDHSTRSALFVVEGSEDFETYRLAMDRHLGDSFDLVSFEDVGITLPGFDSDEIEVRPDVVVLPGFEQIDDVLMAVPDTKRYCSCGAKLPNHNPGCPWGAI